MINKKELLKEYINYDNNVIHAPYKDEVIFYNAIVSGDKDTVEKLSKDSFKKKGLGKLSPNPLMNLKYHFVINAALIARYCISNGLDQASAFKLSDFYINKADQCEKENEIYNLNYLLSIAYMEKMTDLRKTKIYSKQVISAINYIYEHLHEKILISDLASYLSINPSYLSRLFKKETSLTIGDYIKNEKIKTAKNMLVSSKMSISEISYMLAFPNQSHFTKEFKKVTGVTPKKYKNDVFN